VRFPESVWALGVFIPVAVWTFEPVDARHWLELNPIDHGGALAMTTAVGAVMLEYWFQILLVLSLWS
jgi:hypothetical protein